MLSSNLEIILVHCLVRVSSAVSHRMRERYETQKVSNLTLRLQRQFIGVIGGTILETAGDEGTCYPGRKLRT